MATFVDYNLSTFRDHSKPNKRRLQELQHTEARAHAARVAYWRKRKSGPRSQPKRTAETKGDHTDSCFDDSSVLTSSEQHDSHSDTRRPSPECSSEPGSDQRSGLAAARASDNAPSLRSPTQSASPGKSKVGHRSDLIFGDLNAFFQLTSHPKSRLFDPFDTIPSRQGEEVVTAMDHFIHHWAPSQRPGLKFQTKDNPLIRDVFPSALQNVELFEASVALCLSFKAAGSNFTTYLRNACLHHKGEALAGIRNKLMSGRVDEAVIFATVLLMIIDNVFLDVEAYKAHLEGLRKMVGACDPSILDAYGGALKSFVAWAESNALVIFGNPNSPPTPSSSGYKLEYYSHPLPNIVNEKLSKLTPGFRDMASEGHLSIHVLTILENTIRWTRCIAPEATDTTSDDDQKFLIGFDPRATTAMVMELCRTLDQQRHIEKALCKALFIYYANILHWTCRCSGYKRVTSELADNVLSTQPQKQWEKGFWSWMSLLITNAARRGSLSQLQSDTMNKFFGWVGRNQDWDEIVETLKTIMYHDGLGGEWRLCWSAGMSHIVL